MAEQNIQEACTAGLTAAILRFSNVFGNVFDHSNRVIPAFCRAALHEKRLDYGHPAAGKFPRNPGIDPL